ncbi:hypothetical protein Droror1_Dr00026418 [Drosera rotundifolia]
MGNYRFKLSEMIPNAWFYKLKDLSSTKPHKTHSKQNSPFPPQSQHHHYQVHKTEHHSAQGDSHQNISDSRKSYYITRKFITKPDSQDHPETFLPEKDPPRKSSRKRPTKRNSTSTKSSSSSVFSSNRSSSTSEYRSSATIHSKIFDPEPESSSDPIQTQFSNEIPLPSNNRVPCSASCLCRLDPAANPEDDVIVSVDVKSLAKNHNISNGFDSKLGIVLPPIIAKSEKFKKNRASAIDGIKEQQSGSSMRRLSSSSPGGTGVRLRVNSPRIMGSIGGGRRSISGSRRRKNKSESFAIVKSSFDPKRDFKESMVEMILENDITGSKELEELLACYLELNSDEYHDLIVKVFKQIWFDLNGNKQNKWKLPKN